jgi:molybdate transport system substrate-binding protein
MKIAAIAATLGLAVMLAPVAAGAAEIKVIASVGVKAALEDLKAQFERGTSPLPAELQTYVVFTAGISPGTRNAAAAKSLIDFLKAPAAAPGWKAKGLEPA